MTWGKTHVPEKSSEKKTTTAKVGPASQMGRIQRYNQMQTRKVNKQGGVGQGKNTRRFKTQDTAKTTNKKEHCLGEEGPKASEKRNMTSLQKNDLKEPWDG